MVFPDISSFQKGSPEPVRISSAADRLLANVFDVVLFIPVFSFLLANLYRKWELMYFLSPGSVEFFILCGVLAVFTASLTILFQSLFIYFLGASPGKYFLKLKVVSHANPNQKLRYSQCLLRSFLWVMEALSLCLPFLEVLSESQRRPLHDRAAGTMVVTLKKEGDTGPHLLETHFIRQLLMISSLAVFTWVVLTVGHFYKLAVRGEFKKSELESNNYLCSSVTNAITAKDSRLDKALAMYLADEISEECLAAEADFVLWTPDQEDKAWAYLAKGFLKKYDSEQFTAYLQKACDVQAEGEPCEIAQYESNPSQFSLPKGSLTAQVLRVTQDFEKGQYVAAEQGFTDLARHSGFENFVPQGLVKSFWAQNKIEKAEGAYEGVIHQMSGDSATELAAWICHEKLDRECSQESISSCEDLKARIGERELQVNEAYAGLALIREKECRQPANFNARQFGPLMRERKDIQKYVMAISKNSQQGPAERYKALYELALGKESVRPTFLRRLAFMKWVEFANSEAEYQSIVKFLKEKKVRDLSWVKLYEKSMQTFIQRRAVAAIQEVVELPSDEMIQTYQLKTVQVQGHYLAGNYDKAWHELRGQQTSRAPASADTSELSLSRIRADLEKKLKAGP